MLVWGGSTADGTYLNSGGRYNPLTDSWLPIQTDGAPSPRSLHSAVWTSTELLVWGGAAPVAGYTNSGARYNPSTDTWLPMSTTGAPSPRMLVPAVWTGSKLLVWGGYFPSTDRSDGAIYDPSTDGWNPIATSGAPSARRGHVALWTGTEMVVWGGYSDSTGSFFADGGRYDPARNVWLSVSGAGSQGARAWGYWAAAVWTGGEMLTWGGEGPTGGHWDNDGTWYVPSRTLYLYTKP